MGMLFPASQRFRRSRQNEAKALKAAAFSWQSPLKRIRAVSTMEQYPCSQTWEEKALHPQEKKTLITSPVASCRKEGFAHRMPRAVGRLSWSRIPRFINEAKFFWAFERDTPSQRCETASLSKGFSPNSEMREAQTSAILSVRVNDGIEFMSVPSMIVPLLIVSLSEP